jgi:hypothetical protein
MPSSRRRRRSRTPSCLEPVTYAIGFLIMAPIIIVGGTLSFGISMLSSAASKLLTMDVDIKKRRVRPIF